MSNKEKLGATLKLKAVYEGAELHEKLRQLRIQQDVLRKSGLDKESMRLEPYISDTLKEIKNKVDEALEQRKALIREMLLCFAAGDIATACADNVEQIFSKLAFGRDGEGGKAIAQLFHMQANEWNRCVQMVDGMGQNDKVSMFYSQMAEEIVQKTIPVIYETIDRYMSSKEGEKLL